MKTSHIITRTAHHTKWTPIPTDQYLCNGITMAKNQLQPDGEFDKLVNAYSKAYAKTTGSKTKIIIMHTVPKKKANTAPKHKLWTIHKQ